MTQDAVASRWAPDPAKPFRLLSREVVHARPAEPGALFALGARLRSPDALDTLSRRATGGSHDWDGLRRALSAEPAPEIPSDWDPLNLCFAALLACVLTPEPAEFALAAATLGRFAGDIGLTAADSTPGDTTPGDTTTSTPLPAPEDEELGEALRLAVQLSALAEQEPLRRSLAARRDRAPEEFWAAETDALRGSGPEPDSDPERRSAWWASVNAPVTASGAEPFELDPPGAAPAAPSTPDASAAPGTVFASVHAPAVPDCAVPESEQPLVSVIVPSYAPDAGFLNTVEALLRQSWRRLEVLVIDDCSPTGAELFREAAALDERVRVIRHEVNGGAYRAMNTGLAHARGEFITLQGSDDISHSRRLERQMIPLLEEPELVATTSRSLRMLSDGRLTYFGYAPTRMNMSSLLFRRSPVLDRLGRFDLVRKDADSEFEARLLRVFGTDALRRMDDVLSLVQLTLGSLSRADFRYGWMAEDRINYKLQFRGLHDELRAQAAPDWRYADDGRPASSAALPPSMTGRAEPERTTAAVLADWDRRLEPVERRAALVSDLAAAGEEPLGLLHGLSPRIGAARRARTSRELWRSVESGESRWMRWADRTRIGTLFVTDPELLAYLPDPAAQGIRVDRVVMLVESSVRRMVGPTTMPRVSWVEQRARAHFGVSPEWWVASRSLADALRRKGVTTRYGTVRRLGGGSAPAIPVERRAAIGVPLPTAYDRLRWEPEALAALLPAPEDAEIVLYDESGLLEEGTALPDGWRLHPADERGRAGFLATVGTVLIDPFRERLLAAPSWVWDCAGSETAVVAPHEYAEEFGAAVTGYLPGGGRDLLALLALDGDVRRERVAAARDAVAALPRLAD